MRLRPGQAPMAQKFRISQRDVFEYFDFSSFATTLHPRMWLKETSETALYLKLSIILLIHKQ